MNNVWTGAVTAVPNVNEDNKLYMLQCIVRMPELFAIAREELKPEFFNQLAEPHYAILWRAILNVANANENSIPESEVKARALIELEATKLVDAAPSQLLAGGKLDQLFAGQDGNPDSGIIGFIYSRPTESLDFKTAINLLKSFLEERAVFNPLRQFVEKMGGNIVPTNMDAVLDQVKTSKERIAGIDISPVEEVVPTSWETSSIEQIPSGVPFLDMAMDGGPAKGEVMVLLGPTGGGKTLCAIMIAVNGAKYQNKLAQEGKEFGYWYYFSYESPITPDIRTRVLGYSAEISYPDTMKRLSSPDQLSTTGNLKDYEKKRWESQIKAGLPVPGEKERYETAIAEMGDKLKLVDMSGKINASVGTKGIDEIVRVIQDGISKGRKPVGIIIDYAGIMVERYMSAKNEKVENEFHYLNRFVNNVRVNVAARFGCIAWVLHQLHGEAGAASPTMRQHHSKARGARNFADNANFAFNIGTKDTATNCCIITCSKARRADMSKDPPIVRVDGAFGVMVPEDKRYQVDTNTRKIVDREVAKIVYQGDIRSMNDRIVVRQSKSTFNANPNAVVMDV